MTALTRTNHCSARSPQIAAWRVVLLPFSSRIVCPAMKAPACDVASVLAMLPTGSTVEYPMEALANLKVMHLTAFSACARPC